MDYHKNQIITQMVKDALKDDPRRFRHSLGVADTAMCLAARHGADMMRAYAAGVLHDNAKCIDYDTQKKMCHQYGIFMTDIEKDNPYLLHAKLGAYLAHSKYGVDDMAVIEAIKWHTTGKPGMNKLEMIVFIADYIEPMRNQAPNIEYLRRIAFEDLELTAKTIISDTLRFLTEKKRVIDPMTKKAHDYYLNRADMPL